jgi:DNA topoisomerase-3
VVNDAKVSDHHAILPTGSVKGCDMQTLPTGERSILSMVITRLICAVGEPHRSLAVTATLECAGYSFTAKGRTVLHDGWKVIDAAFRASLKDKPENGDEEDNVALPELSKGQSFDSVSASVKEGKTSPPKRYTEDTLLSAMESAGQRDAAPESGFAGDEPERRGLGTPATRAGIIEKLIKSGSVERKKKNLIPTDKGKNLIAILPDDVKSAALTAEWEQKLKQVERGQLADRSFMEGIAALTQGLVAAHTAPLPRYASLFAERPRGDVVGKCPRCGADVTESAKGFFCASRACKFALWKDSRFWQAKEKKLDKKIAATLLSEGRVFLSDLKSNRTGKTYAAAVVLEDDGGRVNFKLDFENKNNGRKSA